MTVLRMSSFLDVPRWPPLLLAWWTNTTDLPSRDHRMDRNLLIGSEGDADNAVLAAIGYNFARLLAWLRRLWRAMFKLLVGVALANSTARPAAPTALAA